MKQITLNDSRSRELAAKPLCLCRLFALWLVYGGAFFLLWRVAGDNPWAQAATWAAAGLTALALVLGMRGT